MANDSEQDYDLVQSFHIDDGELDGLRPQECFVLGVEWQGIYRQRNLEDDIQATIHPANENRLTEMLKSAGYTVECRWYNDDWKFLRATK